jgi:hypothetical protein
MQAAKFALSEIRHRPKPQIAIKSRRHEYAAGVTAGNGEHLEGDAPMPLSISVRSDTMDAIPAPVPAGYQSVIKNVDAAERH